MLQTSCQRLPVQERTCDTVQPRKVYRTTVTTNKERRCRQLGFKLKWGNLSARNAIASSGPARTSLSAMPGRPSQGRKVLVTTARSMFQSTAIKVGKQLGEGSFGVVYQGTLTTSRGEQKVVLKRAKPRVQDALEMHQMEKQLNERVRRSASGYVASYLGTCEVTAEAARGPLTKGLWLVWRYEGSSTLYQHMRASNYPQGLAKLYLEDPPLEGRGGRGATGRTTRAATELKVAQKAVLQVMEAVGCLHSCGLVHRDVKPANLVLCEEERRFKLIDLGACADLRTGVNYAPNETILDPKYSAPEEYCLPQEKAPDLAAQPMPVAMALGASTWMAYSPDRFDMYSVGVILMQLTLPPLRSDMGLQRFNREFKNCGYELKRWRRMRRLSERDTRLLDLDGGAGWELAQALLNETPKKRPSANTARSHRWFRCNIVTEAAGDDEYAEPSLAASASEGMQDALAMLRRLERSVMRRQETVKQQAGTVKEIRKDVRGGATQRAQLQEEEEKLAKMQRGLDTRLSIFEAAQLEVQRRLGISETQIKRAEDAANAEAAAAAAAAEAAALEEEQRPPGWGTRLRRWAGYDSAAPQTEPEPEPAPAAVYEEASSSSATEGEEEAEYVPGWGTKLRRSASVVGKFGVKVATDVATEVVEDVKLMTEEAADQAQPDTQAGRFLRSVVGFWQRKPQEAPSAEEAEAEAATEAAAAAPAPVAEGAAPRPEGGSAEDEVEYMREQMQLLEREVDMMAEKMRAMEQRLLQQGLMQQAPLGEPLLPEEEAMASGWEVGNTLDLDGEMDGELVTEVREVVPEQQEAELAGGRGADRAAAGGQTTEG